MDVHEWVWWVTLVGLTALLLFDLIIIGRRPHEPSLREATAWVVFYVALAIVFGIGIFLTSGGEYAAQFFGGWLTEYSLSVDNLFVFVIIMTRFAVPRQYQQKVLLIGIVLALLMRGAFIAAGAAAVNRFSWVFYLFGIFLIYTAIKFAKQGEAEEDDYKENALIRLSRRVLPVSRTFDGGRLTTHIDGRRMLTPLVVVLIAIGTTDLIFALDSIPAIFGLTQEPYLVFTANVFALMGLRQLYFLLGGLLDRLVYLSIGLAVILGFIGIKLILEAMHKNNLPFINGGEPIHFGPDITIEISLIVILGTLVITTVASLLKTRHETAKAARVGAPLGDVPTGPTPVAGSTRPGGTPGDGAATRGGVVDGAPVDRAAVDGAAVDGAAGGNAAGRTGGPDEIEPGDKPAKTPGAITGDRPRL